MSTPSDYEALKNEAWYSFMQMKDVLGSRLEQQLQASSNLSNADFTVLVVLSESPGRRCRVFEMGKMIGWEKSRLHHQLTRMCQRGLVLREPDPESTRGVYAVLTEQGMKAIVDAAPAHNREVQRLFFDHLTEPQVKTLKVISQRVLAELLPD